MILNIITIRPNSNGKCNCILQCITPRVHLIVSEYLYTKFIILPIKLYLYAHIIIIIYSHCDYDDERTARIHFLRWGFEGKKYVQKFRSRSPVHAHAAVAWCRWRTSRKSMAGGVERRDVHAAHNRIALCRVRKVWRGRLQRNIALELIIAVKPTRKKI